MQHDLHHRISHTVENLKKLDKEKITFTAINMRLEYLETKWKTFRSIHSALIVTQTEELKKHSYFADDF